MAPVSLCQEDEDNVSQHSLSQPLLVCGGRAVLSLISPEERGTRRGQGGARMRKHQSNGHPHTLQQWETQLYIGHFSAHIQLLEYNIHTFLGVTSKLTHYLRL